MLSAGFGALLGLVGLDLADAKKKKKKKKKKCKPTCAGRTCGDDGCGGSCGTCQQKPVAFAAITGIERTGQGDGTLRLRCGVDYYLSDSLAGLFQLELEVAFATLQTDLIAQVQDAVVEELSASGQGLSVPADRIAVTVL
jgi:hypothetical protein